jgi:hypothetical protein
MGKGLFQPPLQHFGDHVADGPLLPPTTFSDRPNQADRQIDSEDRFGLRHGPYLQPPLGLLEVTVSLAPRESATTDQGRQNGLRRLLFLQQSDGHIDSLGSVG